MSHRFHSMTRCATDDRLADAWPSPFGVLFPFVKIPENCRKQSMQKKLKHLYEFGPFRLDEAERLLLRAGEVVPLTPKAFDVLLVLVQQSGRLLEKETLL